MTDGQWPNLKVWLAANDLSQADFARQLGLKPNRFAQYMSGVRRMPLTLAVEIVSRTGIPIESLIRPRPEAMAS